MADILLDPNLDVYVTSADLPEDGVDVLVMMHAAAGKAGEGSSPATGARRFSGAVGDYVETTVRLYPSTSYGYFVPAGGSQLDAWFGSPGVARAASANNNGTVRTTSVGDRIVSGLPGMRLFAGANPIQPGPGSGGTDGPGSNPPSVLQGGDGNGGLTPGGTTHGVDNVLGGSGAAARQADAGNGPGYNGGNPNGAPTSGRGTGQPSGIPGSAQIVLRFPD